MDVGFQSPLIELFARGEVGLDVRREAARGALSPRVVEQLALIAWLIDDPEEDVRASALATLARIPPEALAAFLARPEATDGMRRFFGAAGEGASGEGAADGVPGSEAAGAEAADAAAADPESTLGAAQRIAQMTIAERMKAASTGTREERAILIRDPNKIVAQAVLSSPKLSESEIEAFARMTNVTEDVLRVIGSSRHWVKNYGVVAGLVRNPKTPLAISMSLMGRLSGRDIKMLAIDRNIPEALRLSARKAVVASEARKQ